jgi:beta-lactamase superfamily II metal-dependent hydrolase
MTDESFWLHVLPAGNGDALVLEYGRGQRRYRILVDGGVGPASEAVKAFLGDNAELELLVVTHIDNDHIGGLLRLFEMPTPPIPAEVWFNGYRHLPTSNLEEMGPVAGEKLTTLILEREFRWNHAFERRAVRLGGAPEPPPVRCLKGGLRCTVLSPGQDQLFRLRKEWMQVVRDGGLDPAVVAPVPTPVTPGIERMGGLDVATLAARTTPKDTTPANGSSIALLVEWADRRCLLAGDAHPDVLMAGIDRLVGPENALEVDVFKLPHHGSKANVTPDLLQRVRAGTYVFSTDGSGNQRHPHDESVARVIQMGRQPRLAFNYRNERTGKWDDPALVGRHGYSTIYPASEPQGLLTIDLLALPSSLERRGDAGGVLP